MTRTGQLTAGLPCSCLQGLALGFQHTTSISDLFLRVSLPLGWVTFNSVGECLGHSISVQSLMSSLRANIFLLESLENSHFLQFFLKEGGKANQGPSCRYKLVLISSVEQYCRNQSIVTNFFDSSPTFVLWTKSVETFSKYLLCSVEQRNA